MRPSALPRRSRRRALSFAGHDDPSFRVSLQQRREANPFTEGSRELFDLAGRGASTRFSSAARRSTVRAPSTSCVPKASVSRAHSVRPTCTRSSRTPSSFARSTPAVRSCPGSNSRPRAEPRKRCSPARRCSVGSRRSAVSASKACIPGAACPTFASRPASSTTSPATAPKRRALRHKSLKSWHVRQAVIAENYPAFAARVGPRK
jgi:hypothetical protein